MQIKTLSSKASMHWQALDKTDSNLYKGMAILLIVTHNFMHLFPKPLENEFEFYPDRTLDFLHLIYTEPENIIRISLAFLGHYGVQVFVFLSAYGLATKYLQEKPVYLPFLWQRLTKIYPAFILAILAWLIIDGWIIGDYGILGPIKLLYWNFEPLLLKISLLSNFAPELSLQPIAPWWFIPFIFQFYIIFPFLREPFISWAIFHDHWLLTIVLCLISLATSTLVAMCLTIATKHVVAGISGVNLASIYGRMNTNSTSTFTKVN